MIYCRRKMINCRLGLPRLKRVFATAQKQIERGRAALLPLRDDLLFKQRRVIHSRSCQFFIKNVQRALLGLQWRRGKKQNLNCRDDMFDADANLAHKANVASTFQSTSGQRITFETEDPSMSDVVTAAVDALKAKLGEAGFDGSAKFDITGEGAIIIDTDGVRASDDDADVTQ